MSEPSGDTADKAEPFEPVNNDGGKHTIRVSPRAPVSLAGKKGNENPLIAVVHRDMTS